MADQEAKGSLDVSTIMDDMSGYFERRRFIKFKSVLDEDSRTSSAASGRSATTPRKEPGVSTAKGILVRHV